MKKVLYLLPAVLICMIYRLLTIFVMGGDISAVQPIVILYIALPVVGSVLLMKNKSWGSLIGAAMGVLMVWQYLLSDGHQHTNLDLTIGTAVILYYALMGILCVMTNRKK